MPTSQCHLGVLTPLLAAMAVSASPTLSTAWNGAFFRPKVLRGNLEPTRILPRPHTRDAFVDTTISVRFDRPMDAASFAGPHGFTAFGRASGAVTGELVLSRDHRKMTLVPSHPLSAGELVTVCLSNAIRSEAGERLRDGGWSFQFWTEAQPAEMVLAPAGTLSTRSASNQPTQAYGGQATDFNIDEYPDLAIVHEVTADLRVFLNNRTLPNLFNAQFLPPVPLGNSASPSIPADFNGDGNADLAVANVLGNSVSILLGQGTGSFFTPQVVAVGQRPRGIAALDIDGDGDLDVANTNSLDNTISLLVNDGAGVFAPPLFFDCADDFVWALASTDMNNDGLLDLVAGTQGNGRLLVYANNGNKTFTLTENQAAGGLAWMVNCGDLNGDGTEDVSVANGVSNQGSIVFGDGAGGLSTPWVYPSEPFVTSSRLGDLDGDGHLDWVLSSYLGTWHILLNNGLGQFFLNQTITPSGASSCSVPVDLDRDGDLDLALVDEVDDEVKLFENFQTLPVACSDVTSFTYTCVNGRLDFNVMLANEDNRGRHVQIRVGGRTYPVTVVADRAELTLRWLPGMQQGTLLDPAGCFAPLAITCP